MTWAVLAFPVKCKHSIIYRVTRALTQIASFPNPLTPMHTKWFCKLKTLEELPDHKGRKHQEMAFMLGESWMCWGEVFPQTMSHDTDLTFSSAGEDQYDLHKKKSHQINYSKLNSIQCKDCLCFLLRNKNNQKIWNKVYQNMDFVDSKRWEMDYFVSARFCLLPLLEGSPSHHMYPYVVIIHDIAFISILPWA